MMHDSCQPGAAWRLPGEHFSQGSHLCRVARLPHPRKTPKKKKSASLFRASTNIGQKFSGRAPRSPAHTWRAAGITILSGERGRLKLAQQMAGHESPRTLRPNKGREYTE